MVFEGRVARGPTQSVPAWRDSCADADRVSREAWAAWKDLVFAPVHNDG